MQASADKVLAALQQQASSLDESIATKREMLLGKQQGLEVAKNKCNAVQRRQSILLSLQARRQELEVIFELLLTTILRL